MVVESYGPTPCASAAAEAHAKAVKMQPISRAEGGQLQAPVSWQLAPAINQVVFFDSGAIVVSYRSR